MTPSCFFLVAVAAPTEREQLSVIPRRLEQSYVPEHFDARLQLAVDAVNFLSDDAEHYASDKVHESSVASMAHERSVASTAIRWTADLETPPYPIDLPFAKDGCASPSSPLEKDTSEMLRTLWALNLAVYEWDYTGYGESWKKAVDSGINLALADTWERASQECVRA